MEWYVYRHDSNKGKIVKYNVINTGVINHLIERLNQIKKEKGRWNYDDFTVAAMQIYRYYYWGKCEHEIIIKEWVGKEAEEKVDVFDQLMLNWDIFVDHLYDYVIELISSKGEEENEECPEDCLCRTCAAAKDCDRLTYESCCGCRKTEDDMVTRCTSFVEEEYKAPAAKECKDCQCSDCTYKDTIFFCPGCNYCENGNDFLPKGECLNYIKKGYEENVEINLAVAAVDEEEPTCDSAWWIADGSRGVWICANCKSNALYWGKDVFLSDFCPHCGARMENCSCGILKEEEK